MISDEVVERESKLSGLRELIKWLEDHPEIPMPSTDLGIYQWDTLEEARTMARAMGTFNKEADSNFLRLTKYFGPVQLKAVFSRSQVCERVVVETRQVPEKIIPSEIIPAHEEEVVEWKCPPLLLHEEDVEGVAV